MCERAEGGRAAIQFDLLVLVLPSWEPLVMAADYTVVDLTHTQIEVNVIIIIKF